MIAAAIVLGLGVLVLAVHALFDGEAGIAVGFVAFVATVGGVGFALGWEQAERRCAERPAVERPAPGRVGPSGVARRAPHEAPLTLSVSRDRASPVGTEPAGN